MVFFCHKYCCFAVEPLPINDELMTTQMRREGEDVNMAKRNMVLVISATLKYVIRIKAQK